MVEIDVVYEGGLHTHCLHGPSQAEVATDAPRDNHGRGESFSPTDLATTALASCMLTVMGIKAQEHDWKIDGMRASCEKHMTADPVRRIGRIVVRFSLASDLSREATKVLERTARTCPVAMSLNPDIELDVDFDWEAA